MASQFSFNAYALGLGGNIGAEQVPSIGCAVLGPSGGTGRSLINNYTSPLGGITATSILSTVKGGEVEFNKFEAEAWVAITGLTVRDIRTGIRIFSARYLSSRVYSVHQKNGEANADSTITFQADIQGLRAADDVVDIDAQLDTTLFNDGGTYEGFLETFAKHPKALEYADHFGWKPEEVIDADGKPVVPAKFQELNTIPVTLLRRNVIPPGKGEKFRVTIPHVGELHIGEAILKRGRRRMSLIRLELESDMKDPGPGGSVSFCCTEGNGTEIMP